MPEYRYRITSLDASSSKYGPCEVCGKHATEVFYQVEEMAYALDAHDLKVLGDLATADERAGKGWTRYECHSYFGHEWCLIDSRRQSEVIDRHERYYGTGGLAQDASPTAAYERAREEKGQ